MTLNNPSKKNAMTFSLLVVIRNSEKMMVDLANCIDTLENWKEGCGLILQGANHTFCSGFDLLASQRYMYYESIKIDIQTTRKVNLS